MVNSAAASNGAGKLLACTGQAAIQPIHDIHFVLSAVFIFDGSMAPTGPNSYALAAVYTLVVPFWHNI